MNDEVLPAQKRIGVHAFAALLARQPGATIIDVRTPAEFSAAHIDRARLLPLADLRRDSLPEQLGATETIYLICQSGARAAKAISGLEKAGLENCVLVEGGMDAWLQAGLPAVHGKRSGLSLLRQVQMTIGFVCTVASILALLVNRLFVILPLIMGCGLLFAGLTGTCGLATLLSFMPWNRTQSCSANFCGD